MYGATLGNHRYNFSNLATLLTKASPLRSGDILAGVAAQSGEEPVAAQFALADLPLCALLEDHLISYESDEITRLIVDMHDAKAFGFRDWLLSDDTTQDVLEDVGPGGAQVRRHDWRARVHRLLQSNVEVRGCRAADKCDELAASVSTLHSMAQMPQAFVDLSLILNVQVGCALVQEQYSRSPIESARQQYPLPLPTGERAYHIPDEAVVRHRHRHDLGMDPWRSGETLPRTAPSRTGVVFRFGCPGCTIAIRG